MHLGDWTDAELEANRRGEIAESQLARLRREKRTIAYVLAAVMIVMIAGFSLLMFTHGTLGLHVAGVVLDVLVLAFGGIALVVGQQQLARDLSEHRVEAVTGEVAVTTRISARNQGSEQVITVGGREVRPMLGGLEKLAGKTVTVYLLPHSGRVFALDRAPGG